MTFVDKPISDWQDADQNCLVCHGGGEADSGGTEPWGTAIFVRCGCTYRAPCAAKQGATFHPLGCVCGFCKAGFTKF